MISPEPVPSKNWESIWWPRSFFYTCHQNQEAAAVDLAWAKAHGLRRQNIRHDICPPSQGMAGRTALEELQNELTPHNTLVCSSLKALGPNAFLIHQAIERLIGRGVRLHFLSLNLVRWGNKPTELLVRGLAELHELAGEAHGYQVRRGLEVATADGKQLGRKRALNPVDAAAALSKWQRKEGTLAEIAGQYGVSARTLTRYRAG